MAQWLVASALVAAMSLSALAQGTLRSPFAARVERLALSGQAPRTTACTTAPAATRDVLGYSYYIDPKHSVTDPELLKKNIASLQPIRDYLDAVTHLSDAAIQGDRASGACGMTWLAAWARGGGMLGTVNHQGEYEREWTLCGLALAYLKFRDAGAVGGTKGRAAQQWLARLARAVQPYYEIPGQEDNQNNHAYWTGVGVAAAGIAAGDRALFDWGIAKYRVGARQIAADGTLANEMRRGGRALHYHLFALTPLVFLAELGAANGIDLYAAENGAIHRLVQRCLDGIRDPAWFAQRADAPQDVVATKLRTDEIAWLEPYEARFPNAGVEALLRTYRPLDYPRLGGNITLVYR